MLIVDMCLDDDDDDDKTVFQMIRIGVAQADFVETAGIYLFR